MRNDPDTTLQRTAPLPGMGAMLLVLALAAYACFLWPHLHATAGGSDSSGYLNHARLLGRGEFQGRAVELAAYPTPLAPGFTYAPLGFKPVDSQGTLVCTYPPGLPLMLLGVAQLSGWELAPNLVMLAHVLAALVLTWLLARRCGLPLGWSLLAPGLLAFSPIFLNSGVQLLSDIPAAVWLGASLLCALQAREGRLPAFGAGFCLGVAVLLRPTNLLGFLPLLLAIATPTDRSTWRSLAWVVLGGLPSAAVLLILNRLELGSWFASGYGDVGQLLTPANLGRSLLAYVLWLPASLGILVPAALALPWLRSRPARPRLVLGSWILVVAGFYAFYFHTGEDWTYMRFLVPAAPALLVAALLALESQASRIHSSRTQRLALPGLALLCAGLLWAANRHFHALSAGRAEQRYDRACESAKAHLPRNAVILAMQCSGALRYRTDFLVARYDMLRPAAFARLQAAAAAEKRPIYALIFPFEQEEALRTKTPGDWQLVSQVDDLSLYKLKQP